MKSKKMLFGIAGVLAVISSVNAADTDAIRQKCQSSDKTLWVENNQVCIPRNPCDTSRKSYEANKRYCNRLFSNVQTEENGYKILIDLYAQSRGLSCVPLSQDGALVGQDYVVCYGKDVMVFEFDDISDVHQHRASGRFDDDVCVAAGGVSIKYAKVKALVNGEDPKRVPYCDGLTETDCNRIDETFNKYGVSLEGRLATWSQKNQKCRFHFTAVDEDAGFEF